MEYKAITGENFYYSELKNAARYMMKHPETEDIRTAFKEEDVLDVSSESNFQKKFLSIKKRLPFLTEELKYYLVNADANTGKFINMYTILCSERIVLEFMDEFIKEKYAHFDYYVKDGDFTRFLQLKSEHSEVVEKWSEAGKKKVIVKLKNFLTEGGFLHKEEDKLYRIVKPIVLTEVIEEIKKEGNRAVLRTMLY